MQLFAALIAPAAATPAAVFLCEIGLASGGPLAYLLYSAAGMLAGAAGLAACGVLTEDWDA